MTNYDCEGIKNDNLGFILTNAYNAEGLQSTPNTILSILEKEELVQMMWEFLNTKITLSGTIGKTIKDDLATIKSKTGLIPATL